MANSPFPFPLNDISNEEFIKTPQYNNEVIDIFDDLVNLPTLIFL